MVAEDAVLAAPDLYTLLMENDEARVIQYRGKPGTMAKMHSHLGAVAVVLKGGTLRFTPPDGKCFEQEFKDGEVVGFYPPEEHTTENVGSTEVEVVIVELK